jgi:hypothetical protein
VPASNTGTGVVSLRRNLRATKYCLVEVGESTPVPDDQIGVNVACALNHRDSGQKVDFGGLDFRAILSI